ncbi:hypothetical protein BVX98_00210 [bacterium F11]|nr:hypothetical protein BVX98_00210 [bacterium F11]
MSASDPFGLLAFLHWNHDWNRHHFPEKLLPKAVDQIADLGIRMVRLDILWCDVQLPSGQFDFDRYHNIISLLKERNIDTLGLLQYNKFRVDENNQEIWNHPPENFSEFSNYVSQTVQHFKNQVKHWEIWNEPNLPFYWTGPKDGLKRYSELLKESYLAAKKADSQCLVLNGGLASPVMEDVTNLYQAGAAPFFDILNIHTFFNPISPAVLEDFDHLIKGIRSIMDTNADTNKPIWITEVGCPGLPDGTPQQNWFSGGSMNETQQADWLEIIYERRLHHPSLKKIFWAFYRDLEGEFKDATDYLGIVRNDLTPKPAYWRFKKIIETHNSQCEG